MKRKWGLLLGIVLLLLLCVGIAGADEVHVSDEAGLRNAISTAVDERTIYLDADISMIGKNKNIIINTAAKIIIDGGYEADGEKGKHLLYREYSSGQVNLFQISNSEADLTIRNCTLSGSSRAYGVRASGAKQVTIENTTFTGFSTGAFLSGVSNVMISGCDIKVSSTGTGISYVGSANSDFQMKNTDIHNVSTAIKLSTAAETTKVQIDGCNIYDNTKDDWNNGAICLDGFSGKGWITNTIITNNSGSTGGGLYLDGSGKGMLEIDNCIIQSNETSGSAGGMYIKSSPGVTISNTKILENSANGSGGGIYGQVSKITITDSLIEGNSAGRYGGGLHTLPTTEGYSANAMITINNSEFLNNNAGAGGAISVSTYYNVSLINSKVIGNKAISYASDLFDGLGGGIYISGFFNMENSEIADNEAGGYGGGIYLNTPEVGENAAGQEMTLGSGTIHGNKTGIHGGGVYLPHGEDVAVLTNTVIYENKATRQGGGVWICPTGDSSFYVTDGTAVFKNTANAAGDDVVIQQPNVKGESYYTILSPRMLGGLSNHYYDDGKLGDYNPNNTRNPRTVITTAPRYQAGVSKERTDIYTVRDNDDESLVLKNIVSADAEDRAKKRALVFIYDNEAGSCGGGVASNGRMMFGQSTELPITITARKDWADGNEKHKGESVTVMLHQYEPDQRDHDITPNFSQNIPESTISGS